MPRMLSGFYYSFPIQLIILHFKQNLLALSGWILFVCFFSGFVGRSFGIQTLFLDPEYLGKVGFWSFFFIGFSYGGFVMSWNITSYILHSYRFPFLASLQRPFSKFCINNSLIPLLISLIYLIYFVQFQWYSEYATTSYLVELIFSFFLGVTLAFFYSGLYFQLTNKDIFYLLNKKADNLPINLRKLAKRKGIDPEALIINVAKWRVDNYITDKLKLRLTRNVEHYDNKLLIRVFQQNRANAIMLQILSIIFLISLGAKLDYAPLVIPAGASMLLLFSVLTSLIGALSYWLGKWQNLLIMFLVGVITYTANFSNIDSNRVYGLKYNTTVEYNYESLGAIANKDTMDLDKESMIQILNKWRMKFGKGMLLRKPKIVFLNTSGGGSRAALFTTKILQEADSLTAGKLLKNTFLMSGASGGMLGMAYIRELELMRQLNDDDLDIYSERWTRGMGKDLLNPIAFAITVNDLFIPWTKFTENEEQYYRDRAYMFEKYLTKNSYGILDKKMGYYTEFEKSGKIPLLFITPLIVNDNRQLVISSQKVSFMMRPKGDEEKFSAEIDKVDFGRLFTNLGADSLRLTSALRMNATFPYILPNATLPTHPKIELMDAGWRDNYGFATTLRFCEVFKDWIIQNTSGIVVVQIRDSKKIDGIDPLNNGPIDKFARPIAVAGDRGILQDYIHDNYVSYLINVFGEDKFDLVRFEYEPSKSSRKASLSFHLSKKEQIDILESVYLPQNQHSFKQLMDLLK